MKSKLTDRQREILTFICQFREECGYPPTLREIGKKFGISSTFGVKRHLDALVKKGYLNIEGNLSRGISILNDLTDSINITKNEIENLFRKIPIVGRVAAGSPILAVENIEGSIVVDSSFMKRTEDCFALKVKGDSMINAGIFEGDIVIVSPNNDALNGETIVAMIDGEVTVKKFEKKNNKIRLLPENKNYKPIQVENTNEFAIIGKVVGVVRWMN